jgi:predicted DCC family thiol-disulfide oxidoreductase YuxK
VKAETTEENVRFRGEVFYDAECPICMNGFMRFSPLFSRHGFRWLPMQTPGLAGRLKTTDAALRSEMKLLHPDGELLGGIDTWSYLLRSVWWLWPLGILLQLPGVHALADASYRWLARNRYCFRGKCRIEAQEKGEP